MKLIEEIESKRDKKGNLKKWAIFLCLFDNRIVERQLNNGLKQKSCGCAKSILIAEANKNRIWAEKSKQKISKVHKGKKVTREQKQRMSKAQKGKNKTDEHKQRISESHKGEKFTIERRQKISKTRIEKNIAKLENNPNWNNGSSFEPYSPEFNKEKKQQILKRDNYTCQDPNCEHKTNKLDIHHIDYDKKNNSIDNLITLCDSCHTKTNGKNNRQYWTNFYQNIMKEKY